MGGAPIYKGVFRKIASVTPGRKAAVIYGSTEAEPVSVVFAQEKMALEGEDSVGHCVGQPVFKGSVKIIKILDGAGSTMNHVYCVTCICVAHLRMLFC